MAPLIFRRVIVSRRPPSSLGIAPYLFRRGRTCSESRALAHSSRAHTDVAVVGAGAAGLTAAYFARRTMGTSKSVTLLEKTDQAGRKILMSGGTRCNVLPREATVGDFHTESKEHLLQKILRSWPIDECKAWLEEEIGIELCEEEPTNKLFPASNSAREVRDKLSSACQNSGIEIKHSCGLEAISSSDNGWWLLHLRGSTTPLSARCVILATGGKSVPSSGTDGVGFTVCERDLGLPINPTYPALVPLRGEHPGEGKMPGVTLQVDARSGLGKKGGSRRKHKSSRKGFLFTHSGFSGPSVLDLSHHVTSCAADERPNVIINFMAKSREEVSEMLQHGAGAKQVVTTLSKYVPRRLAESALAETGVPPQRKHAELTKRERESLCDFFTQHRLKIHGDAGFTKAEVTGGGVPLEEVSTSTMEVHKHPRVFLVRFLRFPFAHLQALFRSISVSPIPLNLQVGELLSSFGRIGGKSNRSPFRTHVHWERQPSPTRMRAGFNFLFAWLTGRLAGIGAARRACDCEEA